MNSKKLLIIITTSDNREELDMIGRTLVQERLAACAQISGPIVSHYVWKGKVEKNQEWQMKIKTIEERYRDVEQRILDLHSYELPQIIALPVSHALPGFAQWVKSSLTSS